MAIEVNSDSNREKDTMDNVCIYAQRHIAEYLIVYIFDPSGETLLQYDP